MQSWVKGKGSRERNVSSRVNQKLTVERSGEISQVCLIVKELTGPLTVSPPCWALTERYWWHLLLAHFSALLLLLQVWENRQPEKAVFNPRHTRLFREALKNIDASTSPTPKKF